MDKKRHRRPDGAHVADDRGELRTVRATIEGQDMLVVSYPLDGAPSLDLPGLTPAQGDVARLLALGLTPQEIALRRGTSPHTVMRQIGQFYRRLGIGSRAELLALILRAR